MATLLIFYYIKVVNYKEEDKPFEYADFAEEIAAFESGLEQDKVDKKETSTAHNEVSPVLFSFNPNNLPEEKWMQLGLSAYQIKIIKKYEAKGGRFTHKHDLKKIYGISKELYARLEPYIEITSGLPHENSLKAAPQIRIQSVELNSADSMLLLSVNGIGPVFASRIIKYRKLLGGFVSVNQLMEVYGFNEEKFGQVKGLITVDSSLIQKININSVDASALTKHPYFKDKKLASLIVNYRKQHGHYNSLEDLKKPALMNDEVLEKLIPYLAF